MFRESASSIANWPGSSAFPQLSDEKIILTSICLVILKTLLIIRRNGRQKEDTMHIIKIRRPFLSLTPLTPNIENPKGHPLNQEFAFCDGSCHDASAENVLVIWTVIRGGDTGDIGHVVCAGVDELVFVGSFIAFLYS